MGERRWLAWRQAVEDLAKSRSPDKPVQIVILEIGCGDNVPTIRHAAEDAAARFSVVAGVTLVRVNPECPLADRPFPQASPTLQHIALRCRGLDALRRIEEQYHAIETERGSHEVRHGTSPLHPIKGSRSRSRRA